MKRHRPSFEWRRYCSDNSLPSWYTKLDALYHKIDHLENINSNHIKSKIKIEPFNINYNHNTNIVIFCYTIPTHDRDSGSNRLYEIIKILISLKYNIYFITHEDTDSLTTYKNNLLSLGVKQILSIDRKRDIYCDTIFQNLINNGINFDIGIFYFYDMFINYGNKIKKICPTIKTIVDSVDVHWLRLGRGNMLSSDEKEKEKKAYSTADVVFAVTENDKNCILQECPDANIKILSNIHNFYSNKPLYKKNLIFVGGSNHTPNISASNYAVDIFKNFTSTYTQFADSKLYLVGKKFDQKLIDKISHINNIKILTNLDNDQLKQLYQEEILGSLCPILWGAGIKGKICEAISLNIPVITTNIGNEGIGLEDKKSGFICDTIDEFTAALFDLYNTTPQNIETIATNAQEKLKLLISKDSAQDVLEGTLRCKPIILSIATFNNSLLIERCVNSIIQNTSYPNYRIHVTSNGCTDNTKEILIKLKKIHGNKFNYVINKKNKHFIIAHNDVIEHYKDCDIVLINNDMEFIDPYWLNHLYSAAYSAGYIGCAGGKLLDYDFNISESGACLFNDGGGVNLGRGRPRNDKFMNTTRYVGYVSGCLMYMKRRAINLFGGLDVRFYPCYYEDSDWQYNLHTNGYKTIINPKCEALHMEGASSNKILDTNNFKARCMEDNKLKFLDKYRNFNIEHMNS